jgi:hypothetical protein
MAVRPASSQLSQSLQKSYTQLVMSCRIPGKVQAVSRLSACHYIYESGLRHRFLVRPTAALPVAVG